MRTLEAIWAEHDEGTGRPFVLLDEYRRWTEEQRRLNVGLITENKHLRKEVADLRTQLHRREPVP